MSLSECTYRRPSLLDGLLPEMQSAHNARVLPAHPTSPLPVARTSGTGSPTRSAPVGGTSPTRETVITRAGWGTVEFTANIAGQNLRYQLD